MDDPKQGGEELHHGLAKPKGPLAVREEEVLAFWNKEKIFEKSLAKDAPKGEYVFYDGPPFANGLPHYGHILASTIKDAIPRYRTMQGYHVARKWGWDCHGLPVENLVEKELGLKNKRDIEQYGIEKFNAAARKSIMKDVADWKRIIPRLGRWADMEHDYKTMDTPYTESVWWAFKSLYDKGLIYEGFKSLHYCPHCGTTLSNFEVAQGYKDIDDLSVTVKFELIDHPGTYFLAWTTTPWTLPGNAALAVGPDIDYVKIKTDNGTYILAKSRLEAVMGDMQYDIVGQMKGKEFVGGHYKPVFDYFVDELHKHKTHAWKVYPADFVSTEDGTGIVHIAPAFGSDDLALSQKNKIPLIHHVTDEGKFIETVKDFAHLTVKPKGNPRETDERVAAWLEEKGVLFKKERITHSYPHCWRCDTPLLNWAANSWFVKVSSLKSKLLKENAKVSWVPSHIGKGRFNNGLASAPDWAISRTRFWGAPLPVWRHSKTKQLKVVGSVNDMLSMVRRSGNRYFAMRHGEAHSNVIEIDDYSGDPENHLTEKGKNAVRHAAAEIKKEKIDMIVVSPFLRTRESASLIQQELGLPDSSIMVDERLHEAGSDSAAEVRRRVGEFLFEVERRYKNRNILIVSHGYPLWALTQVAKRQTSESYDKSDLPRLADVRELPFVPFPHNQDYELDLHRPYIDDLKLGNSMEGEWQRVPDVFDCWFESGSMPFASNHYPFNKKEFDPARWLGLMPKGYPADFIAEGLDQTRGWFYSLIVLGAALFKQSPYKNVIVNGLILATDGQKMAKSKKNYPDPMEIVEKYGADSLRYFLLSSPLVRAEDLRFNERGVDEVAKKLLMRLDNVRSFYELYAPAQSGLRAPSPSAGSGVPVNHSASVLDQWILSRLAQLVSETTMGFESYELDKATRPLADFIDDLSTWYVRRSRDRFKTDDADKEAALATLREVLLTVAKIMAPTMPFFADDLYRKMKGEGQSVHLADWPVAGKVDQDVLNNMSFVRSFSAMGLMQREKAGIKIRQPLAKLTIKHDGAPLLSEYASILKDELNIKEVIFKQGAGPDGPGIELDTNLTPELKEEGALRDFVRSIQELRKKSGLMIGDRPVLVAPEESRSLVEKFRKEILEEAGIKSITIEEGDLRLTNA